MKNLLYLLPILLIVSCGSKETETEKTADKSEEKKDSVVVEEKLSERGAYLKSIIGKYTLKSISGFFGANTMTEHYLENGKWVAGGSSNEGGEREGYDIEIEAPDLRKLNSMNIEVKEDLTVVLSCENKVILEIPFNETIQYDLEDKEYISKPEEVTKDVNLANNWYFLAATDKLKMEKYQAIDVLQIEADVLVLKVSSGKAEFDMQLFFSECCNNSTYTFGK